MSELQCVKFGDMAQQITMKVKPKDTSLNTYVGLEHLDTCSLQIKRKGTPQDVIGEKLRVCKGDIIFGKRRVYQRKLAIADFDGICSAHAMVLRPKEDVVDKDFFPFLMQSDQFMERALQISVGSLSPTINWKTLAVQEFTIPSLPDQRRFATTFWAAEDCIVKGEQFLTVAERVKNILMKDLFNKSYNVDKKWTLPNKENFVKLGDYAYIKGRIGWRGLKKSEYVENGPFLIAANHIEGSTILWEKCDHISEFRYHESPEIQLRNNDVIISKDGTLGRVAIIDQLPSEATINSTMMLIRPDSKLLDSKYLFFYLQGESFAKFIESKKSGSAVPHIFQEDMKNFTISLPPLPEQREIAGILTLCDETIVAACANVIAAKALKMKMINEMLAPQKNR